MSSFAANAGEYIRIREIDYRFAEHPALPGSGLAYGQTGRAGTVYQLVDDRDDYRALKVFAPRYRQPSLAGLADKIKPWAALPGLTVCDREVLTSRRHGELLRAHPDLLYAVLMPWIEGRTWLNVVQEGIDISPERSLALAHAFVDILVGFEQEGIAHGDLSGSNLIIDGLEAGSVRLEWVDVEQLYAPGLNRPAGMPGGSPGYAAHRSGAGLWQADMDRFAGAVMLAEILGWCDGRMRAAAWGETYFAEDEMQQDGERYRTARAVLAERWGPDVAALFGRAWSGNSLADCPPFGAWQLALPEAGASAAAVSVQPLSPPEPLSAPLPGQPVAIDGTLTRSAKEKEELLPALAMATELNQWGRAAELYEYLLAGWPEDPGRHQWEEGLERAKKQGQAAGQGSGPRRFAPVLVVVAVLVMAGIYFIINPPGGDPPATPPPPSSTVLVVSGVTATTAATPSRTARPTATKTPVTPLPTETRTAKPSTTPTSTPRPSRMPTQTPRPTSMPTTIPASESSPAITRGGGAINLADIPTTFSGSISDGVHHYIVENTGDSKVITLTMSATANTGYCGIMVYGDDGIIDALDTRQQFLQSVGSSSTITRMVIIPNGSREIRILPHFNCPEGEQVSYTLALSP